MPSKDKLYRSLVDLIPDALVILQDGRYQIVNSAFIRLFGYTQRDVDQGLSFFELVQDKDKEAVQRRYEDRLAGKQVFRTFRIDLIAKDGTIVPCETSAAVIEYAQRPADLVLIRDVSERVHTEDALRKSEAEYHELFENMLEGVYRTLPDGTIIKANPALVEMLGYKSEEELCTSVHAGNLYSNPDNRLDLIRKLEKEGELRTVEILLRRKDGGQITALENARVVRDASGKVLYYEGMLTDITERRWADRKLRESENKFRSITENAVDSIFIKDMARRYTFVNQAMQKLLGLQEDEILGKTPEEIFGPEQGHTVREVDDRTFSGETVNETRCLVIGDKECFFNTLQSPLSMEGGEVTSIMGIVRDITDRKRAEQDAQDLAHIVERSLNEIYIFDAETFRFIQVNYGARENIGYTAEELTKMTPLDIKPEFTKESFKQLVGPLKSGAKEIITFETVHERKDGSLYDVEVHLQLSEFLDKPVLVAIILDITERKQAEEALRESTTYLQNLIDHANVAIIVWDPEFRITRFNHSFEDLTQRSADDVLGKPLSILFPEESCEKAMSHISRTKTGERWQSVEIPILRADGDIRIVLWNSANIHSDKDDSIIATIAQGQDITERRQAEEKLRAAHEQLQATLSALPDPLFELDCDGRIYYVHAHHPELLYHPTEDILGKKVSQALPKHVSDIVMKSVREVEQTGKSQGATYSLEVEGEERWFELSMAAKGDLRDPEGRVIALVHDITERKLSVENLRKTTEYLEIQQQELTEKNIALKLILEHIESQKQSHRQQVCSDIEKAIIPAVTQLKKKVGPEFASEFADLETAIAMVLSKDIEEHLARYSKLTTRESEICDMIKAGMSSKQIADSLNLSLPTVLKHREHARAKLGITGTSLSLSTYLRSH